MTRPPYFPMMIDLLNKHVLVAGGGHIASRRANTLLHCGALVRAVSPSFCPGFPEGASRILRPFRAEDITPDLSLIVAATDSRTTNSRIHKLAHAHSIPVNICDSQAECDFFFPSLIHHDNIAVSVCSAGISAGLTKRLSDKLRNVWDSWVKEARNLML